MYTRYKVYYEIGASLSGAVARCVNKEDVEMMQVNKEWEKRTGAKLC